MNTDLPFDEAIDLLVQRLPARALDLVIQEGQLSEVLLFELDVNHDTIGQLLQEAGVRERTVVLLEALALGVSADSPNAFELLDDTWRGPNNPLTGYVRTLLNKILSTNSL